jgi:adenosine/AMP kinase
LDGREVEGFDCADDAFCDILIADFDEGDAVIGALDGELSHGAALQIFNIERIENLDLLLEDNAEI